MPRVYARLPDEERAERRRASRKRTYEKNKTGVLAQAAIYRAVAGQERLRLALGRKHDALTAREKQGEIQPP